MKGKKMDAFTTFVMIVMAFGLGALGIIVYSGYQARQKRRKAINQIVKLLTSLMKRR